MRQGCRDERLAGERDEPDAVLLREPVEEAADRLLRGSEAGRLDVLGAHRPRHVDGEGDRGLLAGNGHLDLGPCERGEGAGQCQRRECRRNEAPPARRAGRDHGEHVDVRVVDRVPGSSALDRQVAEHRERHDQEREQHQWPGDPHRAHSACTCTSTRTSGGEASARRADEDPSRCGRRGRRGRRRAAAVDGTPLGVETRRCGSRAAGVRRRGSRAVVRASVPATTLSVVTRVVIGSPGLTALAAELAVGVRLSAATAGDAADERPVARGSRGAPGIRAPEDERPGGRDPGIDRAAESSRETRPRPQPRWPWHRLRRRRPPGRRAASSRSRGAAGAGIATQGPATGMQTRRPLHSSAARPAGALTASAAVTTATVTAARITGPS